MWTKMSNQTFQVVLLVLIGAFMVSGDLQLGRPKCGEKRCNRDEFCSSDYFCSSCAIICDTANHNYEEKACQEKCQSKCELDFCCYYAIYNTRIAKQICYVNCTALQTNWIARFLWNETAAIFIKTQFRFTKQIHRDETR